MNTFMEIGYGYYLNGEEYHGKARYGKDTILHAVRDDDTIDEETQITDNTGRPMTYSYQITLYL